MKTSRTRTCTPRPVRVLSIDPAGRCGLAGFTLIELMVALGLAAIISISIMMISSQVRLAYEETVKKVDVYNRFRYAMQSIESDIANWVPTSELEFYQDGRGRGGKLNSHWDPGEEVQDTRDDLGTGVRDGGEVGEFDEFAYIAQKQYRSRERGQADFKLHDAYQIYFQTITYVEGAMRLANVEYFLADPNLDYGPDGTPDPPVQMDDPDRVADLTLIKVIRYYAVSPDIVVKLNETPIERKVVEVATNVTDFRLEYTVEPRLLGRAARGDEVNFVTPAQDYENPMEKAARPVRDRRNGTYRKSFGYGSVKLNAGYPKATAFPGARGDRNVGFSRGEHKPVRFGFQGNRDIQFAQLIPGDQVFAFSEGDRAARAAGQGAGGAGSAARSLARFPSGDYTLKANLSGLLEFEEDVDSTEWAGQSQSGLLYKAPFLPAAIRLTMRVVDDGGENPRTLQRVVWLRRRSR